LLRNPSEAVLDNSLDHMPSCEAERGQSQYLLHTECLQLSPGHLLIICVEKIQNDGLFIKMHDLKNLAGEEFYLVRKTNGTFVRLNLSDGLALVHKEEFRNMVFDLAFSTAAQPRT